MRSLLLNHGLRVPMAVADVDGDGSQDIVYSSAYDTPYTVVHDPDSYIFNDVLLATNPSGTGAFLAPIRLASVTNGRGMEAGMRAHAAGRRGP